VQVVLLQVVASFILLSFSVLDNRFWQPLLTTATLGIDKSDNRTMLAARLSRQHLTR
jgi:hypothetical protein